MVNNKHGFTLIEIVLAMSVLLAGIVPIVNGIMYMLQKYDVDEKAISLVADVSNCIYNTWDTKTIPVTKNIKKGQEPTSASRNIYSVTRLDNDSKFSAHQSNKKICDVKDKELVFTTLGVSNHYSIPKNKQIVAFCYKLQEKTEKK